MDLEQAITKHAEWKVKFRTAMDKHESLDANSISRDNCCELGKWLCGEGKAKLGHLAAFSTVLSKHAVFHREAGKVASHINSQDYKQAESCLESGTPYSSASKEVGMAIMGLIKEAKQ